MKDEVKREGGGIRRSTDILIYFVKFVLNTFFLPFTNFLGGGVFCLESWRSPYYPEENRFY